MHYNHKEKKEDLRKKKQDTDGENVLIAKNFYYFGSKAIKLPDEFSALKVGRGHKSKFADALIEKFVTFVSKHKKGIYAPPSKWRTCDNSWKTAWKKRGRIYF